MLNIRQQARLSPNKNRYLMTNIGVISLALSLSLGGPFWGHHRPSSVLASEPVVESDREATLTTAAQPATRMKQTMSQDGAVDSPSSHNTLESEFHFPQNFIPPGDGRPDNTRGSGARAGSCAIASDVDLGLDSDIDPKGIYPLMPSDRYGLTVQSHPTIFIDFDGHSAPLVSLRVVSESGDYDERATLPIAPDQTIQGFALPSDRPPLEVGKNYLWTLMVACDGAINPNHPLFTGWFQRVAPTAEITEQLILQPIPEKVAWYTEQGYWYDLVSTLHREMATTDPDHAVVALWHQLLIFVDETND